MIITLLICFSFFILSVVCSKSNIFAPAVITSGIWLVVLLLYMTIGHPLNPLTSKSLVAISLWVSLFCFSALLAQAIQTPSPRNIEPSPLARNIFFYFSLLTFPLLILKACEIINLGVSSNWMTDLRLAAIGGLKNIDIKDTDPFYVIIWFVSYLIELNRYSKENRYRVFILFAMYVAFALFTMAKIHFLILFLSTVYILYLKKRVAFRQILIGAVLLLFIFESVQLMRFSSDTKEKNPLKSMITLYLMSPTPAFETVKPETATTFGQNVFRFIYAFQYKSGLSDQKPVGTLLPFTDVGMGTNTYTILYPFYKDFGLKGVGIFAVVIGLLMGSIYNKAEKGNTLFIIIYAFFIYEIAMQYAAEMFFTNFSLNLKRYLIILIPFLITKYQLFQRGRKELRLHKEDSDA